MVRTDSVGSAISGIQRAILSADSVSSWNGSVIMALSRLDPYRHLNIYTVKKMDVTGVSSMPAQHGGVSDGVIVEANWLQQSLTTTVLIHEIGHYLGLWHTFSTSCINFNCLLNGDRVCDTPPTTNGGFELLCTSNTCASETDDTTGLSPFTQDVPDNLRTYMSYGFPYCLNHFTFGQADRMRAAVIAQRNSLLGTAVCLFPAVVNDPAAMSSLVGIFPNPTTGSVTVSLANATETVYAELLTMEGRLLFRKIISNKSGDIDMAHLPANVYILKISTGQHSMYRKIIKY
jgi:hypothetical protein